MDYVELHCHSNFSLLDGASHPHELVARAAALEMPALALTDHDAVYGAVRFIKAAREHGLQPILGAELTLGDEGEEEHHLTLLVENAAGWHNLCYLISRARHARPKGEARLPIEELIGCTQGLIALTGCRRGAVARSLWAGDRKGALAAARRYAELFGADNVWVELQRHFRPGDELLVPRLAALASYLKLGCVATNNVHYATQNRHVLQDVLVCIRHLTTLDESAPLRRLNSEYFLKPASQMAALFPDFPKAVSNSARLAERCHFELNYGLQDLPHYPTPHGMSSGAYLRRLCQEAMSERYPDPPQRLQTQLAHEMAIIERAGLANYFLLVWDVVRFARENGISCQGRGSAANSLVAYLLYISPIDPLSHDLVFERFLSTERQVVPDIDIDFDAQRREEVIQYIYGHYGPEHTAMACTFVTFRSRSAIRDIGKALGLSPDIVAAAIRALDDDQRDALIAADDRATLQTLLELAQQIAGFPRHLGIHSGGMIVTGRPLMGRVPTEPATMVDRVVVQWDKDDLEEIGLVKIDILGLRMLSALTEAVDLVAETTGVAPDLDLLPFDDPQVYEMITQADTIGVFQVESRAQAQALPRLRPHCFNDLIIAISLIRPGPLQGKFVHPFLRRRAGVETVTYAHPLLEPALAETLGVILFQEQVLKVARDLAGFTPGQGEQLRRALGSKRAAEEIERLHDAFLVGAADKDVDPETAEYVFDKLRAFAQYSFPKSHAAAFSVLVYQSAWLKHHHFVPFYTALLNNQPMGFWNPAVLINELRRRGVPLFPVDIHTSRLPCTIERDENGHLGIRLGFNYIKGVGEAHVERILAIRQGPQGERRFADLNDFCRRTHLPRRLVENLILAGGMDSWRHPRRQLLWELGALRYQEAELALVFRPEEVELPALDDAEAMILEQGVMGLSTGPHVMTYYRAALERRDILGNRRLARCSDGQEVRVAGLLVVRQSPATAKGHHFLTLEDEDGMINIIVRPHVYGRYHRTMHTARLLLVSGRVQREGHVISILARHLAAFEA